ncbi:MAG: DUF3307 domain-containing protein [Bacteroidota bacterium]
MEKELLLISLFACHWLADFTWLSTATMLKAKQLGKPLYPIFNHACVHGVLMIIPLLIAVGYFKSVPLILFQVGTHFLIDVAKGKVTYYFPITRDNMKYPYWILMGFDQFLHATVIIFMSYYALQPPINN